MRVADSTRAHTRLTWPALVLLAFAASAAGCGNSSSTPTTPSTPSGPTTETLNGQMAPNGTAIRTFTASQAGAVSVLLSRTDPSLTLGLGVGIRSATGVDCKFSQTVNTAAGATPQISVSVDAGTYCAGAYDPGTVGHNGVLVTVTITHP